MPKISVGLAALEDRPHILYRFYDRTGVLLYVGITVDLGVRMAAHARDKDWWTRVDRAATRVGYYDSRTAALKAERQAVQTEQPLYNDHHNTFATAPAQPEDDWWKGRDDLAIDIIDEARGILGDDQRYIEAVAFAKAHIDHPEDERTYSDPNVAVVTALSLMEGLASDVARLRFFGKLIMSAVPPDMRAVAEEASADDWFCAGKPDASWEDRIGDALRHLSYALAEHFDQPRPGLKGGAE